MSIFAQNPALQLAGGWQRDFPLTPAPYAAIGQRAEITQREVIEMLVSLKEHGILARIGAAVRPNTAGASTLAALAAPPERLDEVAAQVSAEPAVNHNYEREHDLNLWFVVTARDRGEVDATLARIARETGLEVLDLPLERAYHIDLGFPLHGSGEKPPPTFILEPAATADDEDRLLLAALEGGLPLTPRPYHDLAQCLGWTEAQILGRLSRLIEIGIVSRFGCILRHRKLGFTANAMAVWDVDDEMVDEVAERLAARPGVTLCYRRTRRPPAWGYNLFAMLHGRERAQVLASLAEIELATGLAGCDNAVLFSRRCFKQCGARFAPLQRGAA
jgi:DNA-binding Lrp family transcriptional regulator